MSVQSPNPSTKPNESEGELFQRSGVLQKTPSPAEVASKNQTARAINLLIYVYMTPAYAACIKKELF